MHLMKRLFVQAAEVDDCGVFSQVQEFYETTSNFLQKFKTEGPGLPSLQLSKGYEILKQFSTELEQHRQSRDELVFAEKLFDMEITGYPDLIQV